MAQYKLIPLVLLNPPPEPVRVAMDDHALEELMDSIRRMGMLQPLIVVPAGGRYDVVAGHRRYLAARGLGLREVPCVVYESDELAKEAAMLHENIYREDLTAAEEGWLYAELAEKHQLTEEALCEMVRQKPEYIYARLDLVRKDAEVSKAVAERRINFSVAKELLKCEDVEHRHYLLGLAAENGATARVVQSWIYQHKQSQNLIAPHPSKTPEPGPGPQPTEPTMKCLVCGQSHAPYNLRQVWICWTELDWLKKALEEKGLGVEQ